MQSSEDDTRFRVRDTTPTRPLSIYTALYRQARKTTLLAKRDCSIHKTDHRLSCFFFLLFAMYRDRKSLYNTAPFSLSNAARKLGGPFHCTALPNAPLLQTLQGCFSSHPKVKTKQKTKQERNGHTTKQQGQPYSGKNTLPITKAGKIDARNKIVTQQVVKLSLVGEAQKQVLDFDFGEKPALTWSTKTSPSS